MRSKFRGDGLGNWRHVFERSADSVVRHALMAWVNHRRFDGTHHAWGGVKPTETNRTGLRLSRAAAQRHARPPVASAVSPPRKWTWYAAYRRAHDPCRPRPDPVGLGDYIGRLGSKSPIG
jgi:hypothetical protein